MPSASPQQSNDLEAGAVSGVPELRFDGRVAVITGAGTGMGREHALLLAGRGASVVINDVVGADEVAEQIVQGGGAAVAVSSDVATAGGAEAVIDTALGVFGRVDVVVNNAGILRSRDLADTTNEIWDVVLGVNLRGSFLVTRAAWPHLSERGYGRVVFTASNSGLLGVPGSSAYGASKAALWGLTRVLALEGAAVGIRTNAIAPLAFTRMAKESRMAPPSWRSGAGDAWASRLAPSLVSPVVGWLAHEDCELNGEVLSAAGGRVARFFLGLTPGLVDDELTVESVRDHQDQILAEAGYEVLERAADEGRRLRRRLMS
jgi:NAD(P)-dependent dehydrogenase (short-subunit alcohol dehydrogenase family)